MVSKIAQPSKPGGCDVPAPPPFNLPTNQYGPALDRWLEDLTKRCEDKGWVERHLEASGDLPVKTPLDPYPVRGDAGAWRRWWRHYNKVFAEAGASAGGLAYDPPAPPAALAQRRFRRLLRKLIRRELRLAIPAIVAAITEVRRG
jgi:hypothetical protein